MSHQHNLGCFKSCDTLVGEGSKAPSDISRLKLLGSFPQPKLENQHPLTEHAEPDTQDIILIPTTVFLLPLF